MEETVWIAALEQLQRMTIEQLRVRYQEVFAEECRSRHKQHLVRRIAWRLQALAQGDLSERARRRALEIANDADLKVRVPSVWVQRSRNSQPDSPRRPDRRLPAPGTLLTRTYRGKTIVVKVLAEGFEYQGQHYGSLSAVARAVTGTRWNGLLFFALVPRRKANRHGTE
jgi:hypothetical protein